ncbi:DUF4834 family protein [Confluentibacter flavum]|uniref:DUF4834 domain-containing protein n=1 Tax=Confluentibacter flavum TaxID=1909700 RepID=A0A2N3HGR9_9FLAO|nr:DUF4834 family protein [Confluentibacter flavum]PKQ44157.1 DUF4834 domain-containing protein [Confluentibacter flavum]
MLQYASATGILRTLLIILLIYYGVKIITRIFAPLLLKYAAKKASQHFGGTHGEFQRQQKNTTKKEGEVTIDKMPNTKTSNKDVGEYVDYEEID